MARHAYPIHSIRLYTPLEMSQLQSALESADDKQNLRGEGIVIVLVQMPDWSRKTWCLSENCMPWYHALVSRS